MKKNEYVAPAMEVVELEVTNHLLAFSNDGPSWGGDGNPDESDPD